MWYLRLNTNFVYPDNEEVRVGPYYFLIWEKRREWELRFGHALRALNRDMSSVLGYKLKVTSTFGGQFREEEVMYPPLPEDVVNNLRFMWEQDTIRPKTA